VTTKIPEKKAKQPLKIISKFHIEGGVVARNTKHVNVKNKKLKSSSKLWLQRHINDEYTSKAIALGFRARSAFKLIEIQEKFDIFNLGKKYLHGKHIKAEKILDLGCAPGGWAQVVLKETKAQVIGVDLIKIDPLPNMDFYQGDFCDYELKKMLAEKYSKFELILSDIAPNTTGNKVVDSLMLIGILEQEWDFVQEFLQEGGAFVCKVFRSGAEAGLLLEMKKSFEFVKHFKPKSSRKESNEFYVVALNFKKPIISL
jgi:23S rRNA (uridine2552-2'-O)-methyltransferase